MLAPTAVRRLDVAVAVGLEAIDECLTKRAQERRAEGRVAIEMRSTVALDRFSLDR